ncbi:MAG: hypothetical protein KGL74_01635 [Elusimicrobia bacterium]|nr:hypothetical protein [Elusimicrobiota bacterium]MDE2509799.1 hypothetical protein [Elusimicrobiota bacterium]
MKPVLLAAFALGLCGGARAQVASSGTATLSKTMFDAGGGVARAAGTMTLNDSIGQMNLCSINPATAMGATTSDLRDCYYAERALYRRGMDNLIPLSGGASLLLPAGALASDFDLVYTFSPDVSPIGVDPAALAAAGSSLPSPMQIVPDRTLEIAAVDESGAVYRGPLALAGRLIFDYSDPGDRGVVSGTSILESGLGAYALDETLARWGLLGGGTLDASGNRVTAPLSGLGVYSLIGPAQAASAGVPYAYPVPWDPASGDPAKGSRACGVTFANLPSEGTIKIYTVAGRQVRAIPIPSSLPQCACACAGQKLSWDAATDEGAAVASGLYLWRVQSGGSSAYGKLIIIR